MSVTHRKLTTIFSADVQGYSRLMEADEEGTLATLKQYRDAMARLIDAHGGRVVNTWGDGLIAEFPSVVESVRAAIDVQNELAERNAGRSTRRACSSASASILATSSSRATTSTATASTSPRGCRARQRPAAS